MAAHTYITPLILFLTLFLIYGFSFTILLIVVPMEYIIKQHLIDDDDDNDLT